MKGLLITLLVIGIGVTSFFTLNKYIYNQKQEVRPVEPYEATLTGEYLCLPPRDTSGPTTLECAFGIKTNDGTYYALDFNQLGEGLPPGNLRSGEKFTAEGIITPKERLSSEGWKKYPIEGIFTVIKILE